MKSMEHKLENFDFKIPERLISQEPVFPRDSCRLLVIDRKAENFSETVFSNIGNFLNPGDVLVVNDTSVIKAKLFARRPSGGKVEILLIKEIEPGVWESLVKPGRNARLNETLDFGQGVSAIVLDNTEDGGRILKFSQADIKGYLKQSGKTPLPNYIKKDVADHKDYQTIYAQNEGAIAAPTAGFHFTPELLAKLEGKGISVVHITLHCGLSTFRPIKVDDIREHKMGKEWIQISPQAAKIINQARESGNRIVAVGTTSVRSLESAADDNGTVLPFCGQTGIYIMPGYKFKAVDCLITNFHTPCSSNLVLVSAFASAGLIKKAYRYAIDKEFKFFSFGDSTIMI
jgi:S-adenosylmethionine:tRNA ribosyltransferase-isomerase